MTEHIIVALALIIFTGILCQWFAWAVKLPAILFLLMAGIIAGPITGGLDPVELFGQLLFPLVSLSVAIILFEGGLTLKLHEISGLERVVRNLLTIGLLVTWVVTAVATRLALGFSWELSFLFGAITVVTGPTVIVPMLRTVRPNATISNILRWEGIAIDPIGALLAVLVFQFIISGSDGGALGHTIFSFGQTIFIGLTLGAGVGYGFGVTLRNHWLPEYLHNVATLALVCSLFAFSNMVSEESGLLAVTVMGFWLANMKDTPIENILDFKESLSVLLISALFIILAARIEFHEFWELGYAALWIFLAIQFLARPLKAFVSTLGSSLKWQERAMLGWIAPRGIVAAAVSSLFAIRLEQAGYDQAGLLAPLTFVVIIGTVTLQSATSRPLASWLNVAEPEPKGFLIIGANQVARAISQALESNGFRALMTDTSWDNIKKARMENLPAYYGNPISEHADRQLDLVGIGRMLALSPQAEQNLVAGLRYRLEFGRNAIYTLMTSSEKTAPEKLRAADAHRGNVLFGDGVTYSMLASLISQGAEIRSTGLTEEFDLEQYEQQYGASAIRMFAIDGKGRIKVFTTDNSLKPGPGWTIMSLVKAEKENED